MTIILGRAGTVLIAIDLALLFVSILPSSAPFALTNSITVSPGKFLPDESILGVTPQQILHVNVTVQGTLDIFLLQLNPETLAKGTTNSSAQSLQSFLQTSPQTMISSQEVTNKSFVLPEFAPTELTNVTLVLSNPTQTSSKSEDSFALSESLAPEARVRALAGWTIPLGFVATLPWLAETRKNKKQN